MKELMEKIETYNIINYLFPGIIFGVAFEYLNEFKIYSESIAIMFFEYYFTGLVLSRIGSVIIKPILEKVKIVKYMNYNEFIEVEQKDVKIELLQREANQYRTFIATFLCLTSIAIYNCLVGNFDKISLIFLFAGLTILFILSYKKQIQFIISRTKKGICQ